MDCQRIRQQLAIYRELSSAERDQLQEHLAICPNCSATLAAYSMQDQLLSALPVLTPSPALVEAVHARTVGQRRAVRSFSWQRAIAALSLLLCLGLAWGTVSRASAALPGDVLYPIKRGAEQVRMALLLNPNARSEYQQRLIELRREEAGKVLRLGRTAQVEFQGELVAVSGNLWQVDGLTVTVDAPAWASTPPPTGSILTVEARAADRQLTAGRVRVLEPVHPTPAPQASPVAPHSPSRTPTARWPSVEPTSGPSPSASPQSGLEPRRTASPEPGPRPSATPGAWGPGTQPSVTPGNWGPGPQPSTTPHSWGPGPQPTVTPVAWGPGPQPSSTPVTPEPSGTSGGPGPGPQPSATPVRPEPSGTPSGPGPQPSNTPVTPEPSGTPSGPGPQPSNTPVMPEPSGTPSGPGPQPSATPVTPEPSGTPSGPGPQPSNTPVTPEPSGTPSGPGPQPSATPSGPGQPPSVTPGPGGR